jgi:hypothetical protein
LPHVPLRVLSLLDDGGLQVLARLLERHVDGGDGRHHAERVAERILVDAEFLQLLEHGGDDVDELIVEITGAGGGGDLVLLQDAVHGRKFFCGHLHLVEQFDQVDVAQLAVEGQRVALLLPGAEDAWDALKLLFREDGLDLLEEAPVEILDRRQDPPSLVDDLLDLLDGGHLHRLKALEPAEEILDLAVAQLAVLLAVAHVQFAQGQPLLGGEAEPLGVDA